MSPQEKRIEAALRCAGRPLSRCDLRAALGLGSMDVGSFYTLQGRLPFVEVDARRWGLVERDVPGGLPAFTAAVTAMTRAGCRAPGAADEVVRALGGIYEQWTPEMIVSAYRAVKLGGFASPLLAVRVAI